MAAVAKLVSRGEDMAGGRKLAFDKQKALAAAMRVYWKKGYVGSSLSDLTEGMGINKPSMYATFGNKETLFVQATEYYIEHYAKPHEQYLKAAEQPLKQRLKNYMASVIRVQCDTDTPKGCYISLHVSEAAGECMPEHALALIEKASQYALVLLTEFFAKDPEMKKLGLQTMAAQKALLLTSYMHGTAAMARAGTTEESLVATIDDVILGMGIS